MKIEIEKDTIIISDAGRVEGFFAFGKETARVQEFIYNFVEKIDEDGILHYGKSDVRDDLIYVISEALYQLMDRRLRNYDDNEYLIEKLFEKLSRNSKKKVLSNIDAYHNIKELMSETFTTE